MAYNPFVTRSARVTVTVTRLDSSGSANASTYQFVDHRMVIRISEGGGRMGNAHVQIYGMQLADMNNISRLWVVPMQIQTQDELSIDVWNGSNYVPFFQGIITWAGTDGSGLPDVVLNIESNASAALAQTSPAPFSAAGTQTLQNVLSGILQNSGYTLDYASTLPPTLTVTNPRYSGSMADQLDACLRAFPTVAWDIQLQRVRVYPVDQPFEADPVTLSSSTGMKNAPNYSTSAMTVETLFDPRFVPGRAIVVDSAFVLSGGANWICKVLNHVLEPNKPKGLWNTSIAAIGIPNDNGTGTPASTP